VNRTISNTGTGTDTTASVHPALGTG
jgi:hypothetical protein